MPRTSCPSDCASLAIQCIVLIVLVIAIIYTIRVGPQHARTQLTSVIQSIENMFNTQTGKEHFRSSHACKNIPSLFTDTYNGNGGGSGRIESQTIDGPAPIDYTMGSLDGIRLKTGCPGNWRDQPCGANFANSRQNHVLQGNQLPLKTPTTKNLFPDAPPVDGRKGSPKSMFMLAYNQSHPACCPSTYSTDRGCVCTTPAQREWLARGGNWSGGYKSRCN